MEGIFSIKSILVVISGCLVFLMGAILHIKGQKIEERGLRFVGLVVALLGVIVCFGTFCFGFAKSSEKEPIHCTNCQTEITDNDMEYCPNCEVELDAESCTCGNCIETQSDAKDSIWSIVIIVINLLIIMINLFIVAIRRV